MQAKNGSIIATVIICAVILLACGWYGVSQIPDVSEVVVPTVAEIAAATAALISVPEAPAVDTGMIDRICELTDGCEYWEPSEDAPGMSEEAVFDELNRHIAREDFREAFGDLIGLDFDDGEFKFVGNLQTNDFYKDHQIRASNENAEDDNWEAKIFLRVQWKDNDKHYDSGETEVTYVVVTSVLDEGDYDSLSIEEVDRRFEFD